MVETKEMEKLKAAKFELVKIQNEIQVLTKRKSELAMDINVPLYKAKEEAEKMMSESTSKAEAMVSAARNKMIEANSKLTQANDILSTAKGESAKLESAKLKFEEEKLEFSAYKFAHENAQRNLRNSNSEIMAKIRADHEEIQQKLIDIKRREEHATRHETDLSEKGSKLKDIERDLLAERSAINEKWQKIEVILAHIEDRECQLLEKSKVVESLKLLIDQEKEANKKILTETVERKTDLTRQQNDLARQIDLLDKNKAELDEKVKTIKEKEKLINLKLRQNDEKIATIKQLRGDK